MAKKEEKKQKDSFQIKNRLLSVIVWHLDMPLHSEEAIARNRVVGFIKEKAEAFEKDRMDLVSKYCAKEEGGSLKTKEGPNGQVYDIEDLDGFDTDFELLRNEYAIFDLLPSTRGYWRTAKKILEKTKQEMNFVQTEEWQEAIESIEL